MGGGGGPRLRPERRVSEVRFPRGSRRGAGRCVRGQGCTGPDTRLGALSQGRAGPLRGGPAGTADHAT